MIDEQLIQKTTDVDDKDRTALKQKQAEAQLALDAIYKERYARLTRFRADNLVRDIDAQVKSYDSFISECEAHINRELREAAAAMERAEKNDWPREGPLYEFAVSLSRTIYQFNAANHWRAMSFEALDGLVERLNALIQDSKDTELETQKLDAEKSLTAEIRKDYQDMLRELRDALSEKDRRIIELTDNMRRLVAQFERLIPAGVQLEDERQVAPAPEANSTPQLSGDEQVALRSFKKVTERIKFIAEKHPEWSDDVIAIHASASIPQVAASRAAALNRPK